MVPSDSPSAGDALAPLPANLQEAVDNLARGDQDLDNFQKLCDNLRQHHPHVLVKDVLSTTTLDVIDALVERKVTGKKSKQFLNHLRKDCCKVRPYQVWGDLGPDAVKSRSFLEHLCQICHHCPFADAVGLLNTARDTRKAVRGGHRGVNRKLDRIGPDAQSVLEQLGIATAPYECREQKKKCRGQKRKRDVDTDDEPELPDTNAEVTDISVEHGRGWLQHTPYSSMRSSSDGNELQYPADESPTPLIVNYRGEGEPSLLSSDGDADDTSDEVAYADDQSPADILPVFDEGVDPYHKTSLKGIAMTERASPQRVDKSLGALECLPLQHAVRQIPCSENMTKGAHVLDRSGEVIDLTSVPDSPHKRISTSEPLLLDAVERLEHGKWLNSEAVYSATQHLNPDSLKYYIAQPIEATKRGAAETSRVTRLGTLLPSHKWVVAFVNIDDSHWTVGIVCRSDKTIRIYDPLHNEEHVRRSRSALRTFALSLPASDPPVNGDWQYVEEEIGLRQTDGRNCGVFVVVYAVYNMHNADIPASILTGVWRSVIAWTFRDRLGISNAEVRAIDDFRWNIVTGESTLETTELKVALRMFRLKIRALSAQISDAKQHLKEYQRIHNLLTTVLSALAKKQQDLEESRRKIFGELQLLDEPPAIRQAFAKPLTLAKVEQLTAIRAQVEHKIQNLGEPLEPAHNTLSLLKEEAKSVVQREIDSW